MTTPHYLVFEATVYNSKDDTAPESVMVASDGDVVRFTTLDGLYLQFSVEAFAVISDYVADRITKVMRREAEAV